MVKLLIGGSPCTHWSIAQRKNRETTAEGVGWELFRNYLIARDKFKPDFFLYENNKSAAQPIKDQISRTLGVDLMHINSALVSAQNRQRFYAFNWHVPMPEDRHIYLRDILESGMPGQEKAYCIGATYGKSAVRDTVHGERSMVYEPVGVGYRNRREEDGKSNALSTVLKDNLIAKPVRVGTVKSDTAHPSNDSQQYRVYSPDGKSVTLCGNGGGVGAKTGLYACPIPVNETADGKAKCIRAGDEYAGMPIYEVKDGLITIRGRQYPIRLANGYYTIRKLTVTECCRLQTLPDDYCRTVSNSQAYRGIGNGWTAEVIIHLLSHALGGVSRKEEIIVLSMYDGIGTGRYCLDRMGFENIKYFSYEIDKYAMQVANSNYNDIVQRGDAFDLRREGWTI